jgi:hypothetical protein
MQFMILEYVIDLMKVLICVTLYSLAVSARSALKSARGLFGITK